MSQRKVSSDEETGYRHFTPVITEQGKDALFAAMTADEAVRVTDIALGDVGWPATAAATTLQHECQRVPITGSRQLQDRQQHLTTIVQGEASYWVRELGVYLADGTLLAVWSDEQHTLAWKAANVDLILAFDIALTDLPTDKLVIEATDSLNLAPATQAQKGLIRLATIEEAQAGILDNVALAPATLPEATQSQKGIVRFATADEMHREAANVALTPTRYMTHSEDYYAQQAGDYVNLRARATTKSDVGLSNVPNYNCTSSVSDPSNSKFATAGAVKQAYDKASNNTLSWGPLQMSGDFAFDHSDSGSSFYYMQAPDNCVTVGLVEVSVWHRPIRDDPYTTKYRRMLYKAIILQ